MSRLRRIRRRIRLEKESLATRARSLALEFRGLRLSNLGLSQPRERKRFEKRINFFEKPDKVDEVLDRYNRNNSFDILRLERDIKNLEEIRNRPNPLKPRVIRKPLNTIQLNGKIRVDLPPEHPICVARRERREVLFAFGKGGKGGQRPRRKDNNIKVRCK